MGTPYVLGPFHLDTEAALLFRGPEPVALGRRAVALLSALVERSGTPVSKDALIAAVWPGLSVEESNLAVQIAALRRVLGAEPGGERWIETLPGRGYRFVGPVVARDEGADAVESLAEAKPAPPEGSVRPHLSILVLPFVNIGGGLQQEYLVDGLTESLTTDLSRIAGAFVIARNTAFTLKGKAFDATTIGRELNVRYVLEGSVQRGGDRLRVNVQLIDAESGNHLWADRFDKHAADYLDMQDEIVARLAGRLGAEMIAADARRSENAPNPDASDLHLQGSAWLNKGPSRGNLAKARAFFGRALAIEPGNVEALVGCAFADIWEAADFASPERLARLAAAEASLTKALAAAPAHPKARLALSYVKIYSNPPAQGVAEAERALALDRNLAEALVAVGYAKLHVGHAEEMEGNVQHAFRLSPRDPFGFLWMAYAGAAKLHLGAYEDAAAWLSQSIMTNSNFPVAHFLLAAALGQLGRVEEARAEAEAGLTLTPEFTVSRYRDGAKSDNPIFLEQRRNIYDGLRKAGVPEGDSLKTDRAAPLASDPPRAAAPDLTLPKKPSISVLAFENMSGDPSQEYFADGIVEDINASLSRMRWLFVIARNSSFAYKGRAVDVKQIGRELGVRYVLEGSVRKAAGRVRITGQLIDASSGAHLWAERFEGTSEDIFDLQDRITTSVVAAIAPKLEQAEMERAKRKPTESLDAYDYYLRGMSTFYRRTNEANSAAQQLFRKAIELDPEFASAHAMVAWCYVWRNLNGWMIDRAEEIAEAARLARRAVELGPDDPVALTRGGHVLGALLGDLEIAITFIDRALVLDPNNAVAWAYGAWMRACLGEPEAAIERHARAMRLSPLDPNMFQMQSGTACALLFLGRYDDASKWAEKAFHGQQNYLPAALFMAASHALAGRPEEARPALERVRQIDPTLRLSNFRHLIPLRRAQDAAILVEGMRKAGLPE